MLKLRAFGRVQRTIWRSTVSLPRKLLLSGLIFSMLAWGALNLLCLKLDSLLFPGFRKLRVRRVMAQRHLAQLGCMRRRRLLQTRHPDALSFDGSWSQLAGTAQVGRLVLAG